MATNDSNYCHVILLTLQSRICDCWSAFDAVCTRDAQVAEAREEGGQ
jgi:hypothetical protein